MTLKERKQMIENNVKEIISSSVGASVRVGAIYDLESDVVNVSLTEEHQEDGRTTGVVNYGVRYDAAKTSISLYAFARKFAYDALGVGYVVTEPIYVDEDFIDGLKGLIQAGMDENYVPMAQRVEEAPAYEEEAPADEDVPADVA